MAFLIVAAGCGSGVVAPAPPPAFWNSLTPGPYAVGFRVLYQRDRTRPWGGAPGADGSDLGRPIRISLWYPADSASADLHQMTYGDYLRHDGPSGLHEFNELLDRMDMESWLADMQELTPPGQPMLDRLLATPTAAYRDAPQARGRFPLVLYSGGKGSRADDNVELGEFLAGHGYMVAVVPQLGPSPDEPALGSSAGEIAMHADDFDAALAALHQVPGVAFDRIAAAGHSAGGEAALELALRHPEVRAVIGLDASYGMVGGARVCRELPGYAPGREIDAALLDLRRSEGAQGVKLDLESIDSLQWSDVYRGLFENAYHGDFTEWGMIAWKLSIPMPQNPYGHTRQIGVQVNRTACRAVVDFLDARLGGRPEALQDLQRTLDGESGVHYSHQGSTAPPSPPAAGSSPE
ncbi:MAG TPA: acyl-CoA thioester hydrolase/BAAT C-terminal domain-containing protein [Candidatus Saccharimonadales bacterium]|nr:acyl-CoA thioester hydrolase/BAAT C-terminal domain-containing protein [Candidatus Saccharimonadales bacterium]